MADSKGAYSGYREEARKSTPIHIDKLSPEVQAAVERQAFNIDRNRYNNTAVRSELQPGEWPYRQSTYEVSEIYKGGFPDYSVTKAADAARDAQTLIRAGVAGRDVLAGSPAAGARVAYSFDNEGNLIARGARSDPGGVPRSEVVGRAGAYEIEGGLPIRGSQSEGRRVVVPPSEVAKPGGLLGQLRSEGGPPRRFAQVPTGKQVSAALDGALSKTNMKAGTLIDVGQALYPFLTDEIDTDFTIKLIPPQHRKPDETGKVREAIAILDGEPIRLYEGEPWNVPGFESVGVELADYFRSRSPQSRGQDTLGAEIDPADKSKAGLEVRESEQQRQGKKMYDGYRDLVTEKPRPGRAPTFEEEYQVGKASKEPGKK
jgi:hypothetical protein